MVAVECVLSLERSRAADAMNLSAVVKKIGFASNMYRETPGGHTWFNWRIYLGEFAPLLFRKCHLMPPPAVENQNVPHGSPVIPSARSRSMTPTIYWFPIL
jgi:hypothetical protein